MQKDEGAGRESAQPGAIYLGPGNVTRTHPPTHHTHPEPAPPAPGERVGRYLIGAELGRGGMGVVLEARDPALDRSVALKLLSAGADATASQVARFLAEARVASSLRHPNIVTVHDVGEADGRFFMAMDRIEGRSLAKLIEEGRLVPARALEIVLRVARALEHAHDIGVVHRDVKPGNILIDTRGEVFLTDFGLARNLRTNARLTVSGEFVGTPAYASPEQIQGKRTDERSDVYSLGATLFEALTARRPFEEVGENLEQLLWRIPYEVPPSPRELRPELSRDVEAVCLKALEWQPGRRYGTAALFAHDVERALRGERVKAQSLRSRRVAHALRRAWPYAVVFLVVLVGSLIAVASSRAQKRALARFAAEERRALAQLTGGITIDERLTALTHALEQDPSYWEGHCERARLLRRLSFARRAALDPAGARAAALEALREIALALELEPEGPTEPLLLFDAELWRTQLGDPVQARASYEKLASRPVVTGVVAYARARAALLRGDSRLAATEVERALALSPGLAPARLLAAELALGQGDPSRARQLLDALKADWWSWSDPEPFRLRATALEALGESAGALRDLDHAVELDPADGGLARQHARVLAKALEEGDRRALLGSVAALGS